MRIQLGQQQQVLNYFRVHEHYLTENAAITRYTF